MTVRQENGMRQYVGLIHKEDASDHGVSFPDFPGVVTAGASLGKARKLAEQALASTLKVSSMTARPFPFPPPLPKSGQTPAVEMSQPSWFH